MTCNLFNGAAAAALCFALSLAPAAASAQVQQPSMSMAMNQAMPYLATAGESDVFEVTSSQIALMRSQDPQVRQFAQMMIEDHTRTTNQALVAARAAGVLAPPPVLGTQHRAMIGQLLEARGTAFDRLYWQQQLIAHQAAVALHQGYAASGDRPQLRAFAEEAVPIVAGHLQRVQAMQAGRG